MVKAIPTKEECFELWDQYHTPSNVRQHSQLVCDIAISLGELLVEQGEQVDLLLVEAGALLHDFVRFVGLDQFNLKYFTEPPGYEDIEFWKEIGTKYRGLDHAEAAGQELRSLGYPEDLVLAVERHDFNKIIDPEEKPQTWEQKLVFYADKRVLHRELVSLEQRFEDGVERYPRYMNQPGEEIKRAAIYELEKEIFSKIPLKPDELDRQF